MTYFAGVLAKTLQVEDGTATWNQARLRELLQNPRVKFDMVVIPTV